MPEKTSLAPHVLTSSFSLLSHFLSISPYSHLPIFFFSFRRLSFIGFLFPFLFPRLPFSFLN